MAKLDKRSLVILKTVHPDLVKVCLRAVELHNVPGLVPIVTAGIRTLAEQRKLVAKGASKTLKSRHLPDASGFACAFDIAFKTSKNELTWDWPPFTAFSKLMKQASKELKIPVEWGGDWKSFKDGPHYQLPWSKYP